MSDFRGGVADYISETFKLEDEILKDIIKQQSSASGPMMNIGPDQGKLIELLIKIHKPQRVLEIGSYFGYSAVWLARALKSNLVKADENAEIGDCEQTPSGRVAERTSSRQYPLLTCLEKSSKQVPIIKDNLEKAGLSSITEVLEGDALDFLKKQAVDSFDLIFIDADKANYPLYLDLAYSLLPNGGVLIADNCLWDGKVLNTENPDNQTLAIQKFNDKLSIHDGFDSLIVTIQDGLAIGIKR